MTLGEKKEMKMFDNIAYLTFMMAVMTGLYKFVYHQDSVPIGSIWFLVGGAWVGSLIVYFLNR